MRSTISLTLLTTLLLAACSRGVPTAATPVAAATLPADVRDLAKPVGDSRPRLSRTGGAQTVEDSRPRLSRTGGAKPVEDSRPRLSRTGGAQTGEAPVPHETAPAAISATGELISPMRSQVAPKQPGRVAAVFVREGARVRAGQPLAAFETDYLRLDLQRAEADLARASVMESDAARELERKRELVATDSVSRVTFDHAQTAHESALAARQAASVVVATIRQRIADATLRAPFAGVIESRAVDVGERIGENQPAFVIAQTSPLKLRFRLPEQYLGSVREGQEAKATTDAYGTTSFTGRITMIGGVIDATTRTLVAEADIDNSDGRLRPGMFARVSVGR